VSKFVGFLLFVSSFFVFSFSVWAGYSLVVEGLPTEIDSTQSFSYTASFSGETYHYRNKTYFLRGVFCSPDSTSYFGFTLSNLGEWVSNPTDKSQLFSITTSPEGTWSGQLQAVVDDGGGMEGFSSGEYFFKLGRYTSSADSSADWIEPVSLVVNFPSPSPTSTPTSTPEPTNESTPTSTVTEKVTASSKISLTASPSSSFISHLQTIFLGSSSPLASGSVLATSSARTRTLFSPLLVFGSGLFLFSASLFLSKPKLPWGRK